MNNILLEKKNIGFCGALTGSVCLYVVFVRDPESTWSDAEIAEQRKIFPDLCSHLLQEAKADGVRLQLFLQGEPFTVSEPVNLSNCRTVLKDAFAAAHGAASLRELNEQINRRLGTDATAFLFVLNKQGRNCAYTTERSFGKQKDEYLMLYQPKPFSYLHELLHLFGAADLYLPEPVRLSALQHFPDSVMLSHYNTCIDDLTRYLIGWQNAPSPEAKEVLEAAEGISHEEFSAAKAKQWDCEDAVIHYRNGTYYGPMHNGMRNGYGRYEFKSGQTYEGNYVNNRYEGEGVLHYSGNAEYRGSFRAGQKCGHGVFRYENGAVYNGMFENNLPNGKGEMRYPSGTVIRGIFKDGKLLERTP